MEFDDEYEDQEPPPSLPKLELNIDQLDELAIKLKLKDIILTGEAYKFDISTDIKRLMRNEDSLIALFAVRAISEMTRSRSHRVLYTDKDSMRPIFEMMESEMIPENILVFKHCCRALGNMCCENMDARRTFLSFDGVNKIKRLLERLLNNYTPQVEQMIGFPIKVLLNFTLGGRDMAKAVHDSNCMLIFEKLLMLETQKENMSLDTISSIVAILNAIHCAHNNLFFPPSLCKAILIVLRESKNVDLTELCLEFLITQINSESVRTMIMENDGIHLLCDRINIWLERSGIGQCDNPYIGGYLGGVEIIDDSDDERSLSPPVEEQPEQVNLVNGNLELPIQNMEIDGGNDPEIQNAEISQNPGTPDNGEATPRRVEDYDDPPRRRNSLDGEASESVTQSGDAIPSTRRREDEDDDNMENNEALAVELVDDLPSSTTSSRRSRRRIAPVLPDEDFANGDNNEAIPVQVLDSDSDDDEVVMVENEDPQSPESEPESEEPPSPPPPENRGVYSPEEFTKRKACDLIVMTLLGDEATRILFQDGHGEVYQTMVRWMHCEDLSMVATSALTIGNFARDEYHSVKLMDSGIYDMLFYYFEKYFDMHMEQRVNAEEDFDEINMIKAQHALLSAMRNLCVPAANKGKIVNDGRSVGYFVDALPKVTDYYVAFKLLAVLRMLSDGYPGLSSLIVSSEGAMRALSRWGRGRDHNGPGGEAPRLLAVIVKHVQNDYDMLAKVVQIDGCVSSLVGMVLSSHYMMQVEATYALARLARAVVNTLPRQEPYKSADVEENFLAQLLVSEIGKHLMVLFQRSNSHLTEDLLSSIETILTWTVDHTDMCEEYKAANLNEAINRVLTARPNLNVALRNGLLASSNTISGCSLD